MIIVGTNLLYAFLFTMCYLYIKTEIYTQNIEYVINKNACHNHFIFEQKYK